MGIKILIFGIGLAFCIAAVLLGYKRKISVKAMWAAVVTVLLLCIAAVIIVSKFIIPSIHVTGGSKAQVEVFSAYTDKGATASLGSTDLTKDIVTEGTVDTNRVGDYTITYKLTYGGKTYTATRTVKVQDTVSPEIKLTGDTTVYASTRALYKEPGVTATDNYDGDISANITTAENKISDTEYEIIYNVKDSSGNTATAKRKLVIKDVTAPVITLKSSATVSVAKGTKFTEPGYTAKDDSDGDITSKVTVSGNIDTAAAGSYVLTYTVSDKAGNKASVKRTVKVFLPDTASVICLTFDDGPSTTVTPQILDILKKNNVKATFFIVNYGSKTLPVIKRILAEGHAIGIHGYSHDWSIYSSEETFMNNLTKLRDKLYTDTGYMTNIMRFPGGSSNTVSRKYSTGIMTKLTAKVQQEGWRYFDWNVLTGDAETSVISQSNVVDLLIANYKKGLKPGRTNVVLCHDLNSKTYTVSALQSYIDYGKQQGYTFSVIDENTPECHSKVNN